MERFSSDYNKGLNNEQVKSRIDNGLLNKSDDIHTKTYQQIFHDNIFTLFNLINAILAAFILLTGSYENMLFLGVVFSNIIIGTFQEIKAKKTIDKISLIVTMKVCVIRDCKEQLISIDEVVLDDVIKLKMGSQMIADCIMIEGEIEVDESLLTGESDTVIKKAGDLLYSGSFVVGSQGYARVDRVGNDNYASQMVKDAKKLVKYPSQLRDSLNTIIKYIGIAIIPLGILLFSKQWFIDAQGFHSSILSTSAALIGMIPEGLVILTSIALAVGVINLAKHRTLVQELFCLETLARVDVLCLDKTGTITEGKMEVDYFESLLDIDVNEIIGNMVHYLNDDNATFNAIQDKYQSVDSFSMEKIIPFNSKKKYSGVIFNEGSYLMGAYEFLVRDKNQQHINMIETFSREGYRVITLIRSNEKAEENIFINNEICGFILILDKIRDSAKETLDYFKQQGVDIKVISGDHPISVSQVAKRAGLESYDKFIDATTLLNEADIMNAVAKYSVFGRVTPQQKKQMIMALKQQGHIVGMSGDGVNDVLAFKEANVSIAMASGSDIAKSSANLVLLDSNFDALPFVLYEGRRVINNIQRVATLFLTKTIFSIILSVLTLFVSFKYPFIPIHLTFVSALTIGIPAFFLALEPNRNRVENNFIENIIKISLPAAISAVACIIYFYIGSVFFHFKAYEISQLALIVISLNGLIVLTKIAKPYTKTRLALISMIYILVMIGLLFGSRFFSFPRINFSNLWIHIIVSIFILFGVSHFICEIVKIFYNKKRK